MPPPPIADTPSVTETAAPEEDKFRAQHEALLATQEPSNWDKAQRWFAMAEQFLDPSKTTMQSVAGAGRAFSEMSAEQQRAQRQAEFEGKKALLEHDIGKAQTASAAAAEEAKAKREFEQKMKERGTPSADVVIPALNRRIVEINEQIAKLREGLGPNIPVTPENQAAINTLMEEKSILNRQLATIMARGGFTNRTLVTEEDLNSLGTL
jgi:hypothetical protein